MSTLGLSYLSMSTLGLSSELLVTECTGNHRRTADVGRRFKNSTEAHLTLSQMLMTLLR